MESAAKKIWQKAELLITDRHVKADIMEFMDAGEWGLALDAIEDWALKNSQMALLIAIRAQKRQ